MYDVLNAYLENGLKVVMHRMPGQRTIACGLWVSQGSSYEISENNGLSHLAEHLVLNPEDSANEDYKKTIEEATTNGVVYNAATTKDYTCFYFTGMKNTLRVCLTALSYVAMKNREFIPEMFENEKNVVLQEAVGFYSSFQQIKERTGQALWGNTGTGRIIMGDTSVIANATYEKVSELIDEAYVPGNATLVVVGGIDYDDTSALIEKLFSGWKDRWIDRKEQPVDKTPGVYFNTGSGQSVVFSVGFRTVPYQASQRPYIDMLVRILGASGMQSRIIKEIRVNRGLSYTLGGFSSFYGRRGTVGFTVVCDKQNTMEVAEVMMNIISEAAKNGFTEEEIEREKKVMETSMLLSIDNITDHLRFIGKSSVMSKSYYMENELRAINNIHKPELDSIATDLLREENMGLAVIGDCDIDELMNKVVIA